MSYVKRNNLKSIIIPVFKYMNLLYKYMLLTYFTVFSNKQQHDYIQDTKANCVSKERGYKERLAIDRCKRHSLGQTGYKCLKYFKRKA